MIASNLARAALARWSDRLTVILGLPALLLLAHRWLSEMAVADAERIEALAGLGVGFALARIAIARLEFHRTDGMLAADALDARRALRFVAAVVGSGLVSVSMLLALLDPRGWLSGVLTMIVGVGLGALTSHAVIFGAGRLRFERSILSAKAWLRRPAAGFTLAMIFAAWMTAVEPHVYRSAALAIAGVASAVSSLSLASIDAATVRFMAQSGYAPGSVVWAHSRALAVFAALTSLLALIVLGSEGLWTVAAVVAVVWLIQVIRVLAYQVYARRLADWIATILLAALGLVALSIPIAMPLALAAVVWWLWRRAQSTTWLIA